VSTHTSTAKPLAGADLCVHCGFCLQACPTYLTLDDENDSPRGRIVLMKALAAGTLDARDESVSRHLDQCLGCRACETACPSGVPYGQLLEESRAAMTEPRPLPLLTRLLLNVFADRALSAIVFGAGRVIRGLGIASALARVPGKLGIAMATLAATRRDRRKEYRPAAAATRGSVAVLTGCVMEGLLAPVNRATERTLERNGYQLRLAPGQRCCGALHAHAGARAQARELARANIAAFEQSGAEFIAVNSAGCGAAMKEYGHLLEDDPSWGARAGAFAARVRDVSELLAAAGPAPATFGGLRAAIDNPCHLQHGQRVTDPPSRVLRAIGGLQAAELPDASSCCGSAGLYSLSQPELSQRILAPKLDGIAASGADVVVTGNPGCMMHIGAGLARRGSAVRVLHPVELLDAAYAREATK
jgi:glycolate oxidase iron-sulfur subunit